jgi:hypothetical protein
MSTRASVTINTDQDRATVARWAHQTATGTVVTFRKKSRSTEQSAKMWAMLSEVADQVDWYGQKLEAEDWKDIFTASLRHARVVPGIDKGTFVPLGMRTSTMTIEEMSNLIELIYAFGAQPEHPVVFKEPQASDQSNSGEASPSASAGEDADTSRPASQDDGEVPPPPSPSSSHLEWLQNVARMFWEGTFTTDDIEENLRVLECQKLSAFEAYRKPKDCPPEIIGKAASAYGYCQQVARKTVGRGDGLALVAGVVGCDQDDLIGARS